MKFFKFQFIFMKDYKIFLIEMIAKRYNDLQECWSKSCEKLRKCVQTNNVKFSKRKSIFQ